MTSTEFWLTTLSAAIAIITTIPISIAATRLLGPHDRDQRPEDRQPAMSLIGDNNEQTYVGPGGTIVRDSDLSQHYNFNQTITNVRERANAESQDEPWPIILGLAVGAIVITALFARVATQIFIGSVGVAVALAAVTIVLTFRTIHVFGHLPKPTVRAILDIVATLATFAAVWTAAWHFNRQHVTLPRIQSVALHPAAHAGFIDTWVPITALKSHFGGWSGIGVMAMLTGGVALALCLLLGHIRTLIAWTTTLKAPSRPKPATPLAVKRIARFANAGGWGRVISFLLLAAFAFALANGSALDFVLWAHKVQMNQINHMVDGVGNN